MQGHDSSRPASLWHGLGIFSFALLLWLFLTPCNWQSPSLYLPPLVIGLWLGLVQKTLPSWRWRLRVVLSYALGLAMLAAAIIWITGGPWRASLTAAGVILLLIIPLGLAGLALGQFATHLLRRRFRRT